MNKSGVERKPQAIGKPHYLISRLDGPMIVHAKEKCSRIREPIPIPSRLVDILWDIDSQAVSWCYNCAVRKVKK